MMYIPANHYWIVGGDHVYASQRAAYVDLDDAKYIEWLEAGGLPSHIYAHDNLVGVLRAANVPPYHRVAKSTIIARLTDQQVAAAAAAFGRPENLRLRERWYAPDQPAINANDPESVAFVQAIGADPAIVLAPE